MRAEGSVYQRGKDGRWVATVRDPDTGKARAFYGATRDAAIAHRARALAGEPEPSSVRLGEWLWAWHDGLTLRPSTIKGYASKVRTVEIALGDVRLDRLSGARLDDAYIAWLKQGLSPSSVHHLHRTLHRALAVAVRRGVLHTNPADRAEPPKVPRVRFPTLTVAQARAVLKTARGRRNEARWWLALVLGMRQGETLALRWDDVDLHGGVIHVTHDTKAQLRALPLPPSVAQVLRAHKAVQEAEKAVARTWRDPDLVFASPRGWRISSRADWGDWKHLLELAGCPDVRLHDARHSAATLLFELGVPAVVVASILGHSTIRLTLDTYTHVASPIIADALSRLAGELTAPKAERQRE